MRTTHIKSNVVNNGVPKLPTSDAIYYGEIAINYGASGETLSIKNSNDEIVPFSSDNAINQAFEVHAQSLIDLDGRIVELKGTKVESEEFNKIVSDLNQKLSVASESLDNLYNEIVNLTDKINENEVVISESLCDLDKRIKKIDNSYNNPTLTAITFNSITWITDIPAKGGTATKDNCTFEVYAKYDNGTSVDISSIVTVEGTLVVPSSKSEQRHEAGQLTLTASYSGFTATGNVTAYQAAFDPSAEPLTFKISSGGTINWTASDTSITKTIDYKLNNGGWTSITSNTGSSAPTITVNPGDKLQFRGNNAQYSNSSSKYNSFSGSTASFEAEGNIMSLIYGDDFKNRLTISSDYVFAGLFRYCTKLVSAENLVLPATTLASHCYNYMFDRCTSLTTAPVLPATTLASHCYNCMFTYCTSLTTAPELSATTLADYCYYQMFRDCTSLTTAPELPATTLASYCYQYMFNGCTKLTTAPELPATTLANSCYSNMFESCTSLTTAPELPATTLASYCYQNMFYGCTSLTTAPALPANRLADYCYYGMLDGTNVLPDCSNIDFASSTVVASGGLKGLFSGTKVTDNDLERLLPKNDNGRYYLPATTLASNCYSSMFSNCKSLTTAPELPATTLADYCYQNMFKGCSKLTTAPELPATKLADSCYYSMFKGCKSLNYIKCLATNISASNCTYDWVYNVASTGTFVKNPNMTSWTTGTKGIPANWTVEDNQEPLTFNILSAGTINWTASSTSIAKTIDYKLNDNEWVSITSNTGESAPTITVNSGDKIQFRGNNAQYTTNSFMYNSFSGSTALFEVEGNIMSLIYGDDFKNKLTISSNYAFASLFRGCTKLVSAENLILPATTLAKYCYTMMFEGCTSLTTAPALPATTLASNCYNNMFSGTNVLPDCSNIDFASSTVVASGGLKGLFSGTKVTDNDLERLLPKNDNGRYYLPATTLANSCYLNMFYKCTSLTTAPELPATTLVNYCYQSMFNGCTSLTTAPKLPATTLANYCYQSMFQGCTSLTTAPELPATKLADSCYYSMFKGCTSLNYIKCLATSISASDCTSNWVDAVASTGTFVKNPDMTSWSTGVDGIPTGWTVEDNGGFSAKPLTFNILSAGTINWTASSTALTKTIEYKVNNGGWTSITSNTGSSAPTITVNPGDKIQFRGNNAQYSTSSYYNSFSGSTASFEAEGNIMSLIYGDDFKNRLTISSDYVFYGLFRQCVNLVSAENLILPATTLANYCYWSMFSDCTSLTTAPELPATTLATRCYYGMFLGCTSLTTAPTLPATTLADYCYNAMFNGCTSLTTAPALPATTLADYCYYQMFFNCTSLTTAPALPAITLASYCYQYMFAGCRSLNYIKCLATDISASNCTAGWVNKVASTGTFVKNPDMTSWTEGVSGIPTGWTVQDA